MIDDGVASRGHRTNIFKGDFKMMGAFGGPHTQYQTCTVINYVGGFAAPG
jgi:uncharacterized protein YkwD